MAWVSEFLKAPQAIPMCTQVWEPLAKTPVKSKTGGKGTGRKSVRHGSGSGCVPLSATVKEKNIFLVMGTSNVLSFFCFIGSFTLSLQAVLASPVV
jgi:hypothetical protein